jgi:hypothetical protein
MPFSVPVMEIKHLNRKELEDYIEQLEIEISEIDNKQFPGGVKERTTADLNNKIRWAQLSLNTRFPK